MAVLVEKGCPEELPDGARCARRCNDDWNAMLKTAFQYLTVPR